PDALPGVPRAAVDVHAVEVVLDHLRRGPDGAHLPVPEQHGAIAEVADGVQRVRHDDDRLAALAQLVELLGALLLELLVADGEDLVDEEDVGIDADGDREPESDVHARRVVLDRRVDEGREIGELDDLVELRRDLLAREPEDRAVEVDVLATAELGVEPGAELEQRRHATVDRDPPAIGSQDVGDALEHRALPRAVLADEPEARALFDLEAHVAQRPELVVARAATAHERRLQALVPLVVQAEPLPDVFDEDRSRCAHTSSASRRSRRPKIQCPITTSATAHKPRYARSLSDGHARSYSTLR